MSPFRPAGERVVYDGSLVQVVEGTFEDPSGARFQREIVRHPGAVAAVPLLADGATVLLVRQYRPAVDVELLEIPAGKLDISGEEPAVAVARELEEEIGMRPGRLEWLTELYNSPGFCDERIQLYLASDLSAVAASAQGVEEQHMTIEPVRLDETPQLVASGRLVDAKTIVGLTVAAEHLRTR